MTRLLVTKADRELSDGRRCGISARWRVTSDAGTASIFQPHGIMLETMLETTLSRVDDKSRRLRNTERREDLIQFAMTGSCHGGEYPTTRRHTPSPGHRLARPGTSRMRTARLFFFLGKCAVRIRQTDDHVSSFFIIL